MPPKPLKHCAKPGCKELTPETYCEKHKPAPWQHNNESKRLLRGRTLQKERALLFNEFPLCVECLKVGRESVATIRDHIVPLSEGGLDVRSNTQALCFTCSDIKTEEERRRGLKRR